MSVQEAEYRRELEQFFDDNEKRWTMQDRDNKRGRINAALRIVVKFTFADFSAAIRAWDRDKPEKWPSPGQWSSTCAEMFRDRTGNDPDRPRGESGSSNNLGGYNFQQIMSTKEGQEAKSAGRPHSFLMDVKSGRIPVSSLTFRA